VSEGLGCPTPSCSAPLQRGCRRPASMRHHHGTDASFCRSFSKPPHSCEKCDAAHETQADLTHAHSALTQIVQQLRNQSNEPEPRDPAPDLASKLRGAHPKGPPHDDHRAEAASPRRESSKSWLRDAGPEVEGLRHDIAALRDRQGELEASIHRAMDALRGDMAALRKHHERQGAEAADAQGAALTDLRRDLEALRERPWQQEPNTSTDARVQRLAGEMDAELRAELNGRLQKVAADLQRELLSGLSTQAVKLEAKLKSMEADIREHRKHLGDARRSSSSDAPRVAHAETPEARHQCSYGGTPSAPRAEVPHTTPTRPVSMREGPPPQQQRARSVDPVGPEERPKQGSQPPVRRFSSPSGVPSPTPHSTRPSTPGQDPNSLTLKSVRRGPTQPYIGSPPGPASGALSPGSFHARPLSMGPPAQHSPGPTSRRVSLPVGCVSHPPGWHGAKSVPVPPLMMWHSRSVAPKTGQTGTG